MSITLRDVSPADTEVCGRICYEAFKNIADRHNFPPDFPSAEAASALLAMLIANPGIYGIPGHAVAESDSDFQALIASAGEFLGPGSLVPSRNTELLRWCFAQGFRLVQQMTLMTIGLYNEPRGGYLPSVFY